MPVVELSLQEVDAELDRREHDETLADEAERLALSLRAFVRAAWQHVIPAPLTETWHIDAICDHLQAAYRREIPRLIVTIPPGYLKSSILSVLGPAWWWASHPGERIVSASHADHLATRDTRKARELITSKWFQARWPILLSRDENLKTRYSNVVGGYRVATHVEGGTGERGGVLLLDDPHNAAEIQSPTALNNAWEWVGNTWQSRLNASISDPGVMVIIGQRIGELDVIGRVLEADKERGDWVHLCLPARYERRHPFVYPPTATTRAGTVLHGDPRTEDGELIAPTYVDEATLEATQAPMTEQVIASQYQQRPAPREGAILKRRFWRYFNPELLNDERIHELPAFRTIAWSWDTAFKDKTSSDFVVGTCWGARGGDRYGLRIIRGRMNLQATKTAMREGRTWALDNWPNAAHYILIEKSANGVEIIEQLRREITGVTPVVASVDKVLRAEAAAPDLESGNVFVPGVQAPELDGYDPAGTPSDWQVLIEECAVFPNGMNDDQVDSFSQGINWLRLKGAQPATIEVPTGRV